jgi:ATP-binding cassette subfamily B multidrug efflux pump
MSAPAPGQQRSRREAPRRARDLQLTKRLWAFMSPHKRLLLFGFLLAPLGSAVGLVQPWIIQQAIDQHFVPQRAQGLGWWLAAFAGALAVEFLTRFGQFYLMEVAGQRALLDLRVRVFAQLQRLHLGFFHKNPIGRLMTRLTTDIDALQEALSSGAVMMVGDVLTLAGIVTLLLLQNWRLALVTFAVIPPLIIVSIILRALMRAAFDALRTRIARLNAQLQESVTGMSVIQLFVHERASAAEYDQINREHRDAAYASIRWDAVLFAFVELVSSLAVAGIIWYGAGEAIQGVVTLGVLVAFLEYVQKFFVPIRDLSQKVALIQAAMSSAERLFGLLDEEPAIQDAPDALPLRGWSGEIELRDVWFTYTDESSWVLRGVSLVIRRGERVAFVGRTGAGKSTLIGLLTRMYDVQRGAILLDGVDIRRYRVEDLRALFALVLQDGFLFTGTMRENLSLGAPQVNAQDIDEAVKVTGLGALVERHPAGLDREIKERGGNLSVGERQLVTFARALAHRPEILILDEATANVDTETESLLQEAVAALLERQTSIVIAHRLSTIEAVDRIFVLHQGELVEEGSHAALMAQGGRYRRLVELQYAALQGAP